MAVPKRRTTRAKGRSRRAHDNLKPVNFVECPQCRENRLPHQACPHCGYYKGKQVVEVE